jgi:dipeptidyl aminopeptidase/acylaminoacyl peptidase
MRQRLPHRALGLGFGAFVLVLQWAVLAQAPVKRPLSYDADDSWRAIQGTRLSNDGQWLAYALTALGDDGELVVRNLKTSQELRHPRGTSPAFTPDGKFVIFTIVPTRADQEASRRAGAASSGSGASAPKNGLGIMALPSGQVTTVDSIATFRLPEESSTWLAYHKAPAGQAGRGGRGGAGRQGAAGGGRAGAGGPPAAAEPAAEGQTSAATPTEKKKDPGTDLVVRNLTTGQDTTIPDVSDYAWAKDGTWLAYAISSTDAAKDGAFARHTSDGSIQALHTGRGHYKSLVFDRAGRQLAFLSDQPEYEKAVAPYRLYYWNASTPMATELVSSATRGMPPAMAVSEYFAPQFSEDGLRLYLGTAPPPPPPADPKAPPPTKVDLWNYKDPLLQPMQQVRATQERDRNYRGVVHLADKRFVQLATPDLPTVNPGVDAVRVIGTSDVKYRQQISWDQDYNDIYLVDLKTGQRREILEHFGATATLSPGGGYVLYFDSGSGSWFTYHIADGTRANLTDRLPVKFARENHDTPDLAPAYGSAGWTDGDKSVVLYDMFDLWEIHPDGTGARVVTAGEGRRQHLVFRYRSLNLEARTLPSTTPLLLTTTNDDTEATGFYRVTLAGTSAPEKILMVDKSIGAPTKAKDADEVVFTEQRFDEFPDLWVSDTTFRTPQKVSNANPQQAQYVWGKSEKIEYTNADGKRLGALLIKPENFDPAKKYPMIVYIYEELSQGLHGYRAPNVGTSINVTRYVSNGYIVLEPDIVYDIGYPGPSAEKCVLPAVKTVVDRGFIDPKRIGIQGHSWGGYQIAYLVTRTNVFAAVEAGAAVADMVSAYGGIRWGTGMSRAFQYEKTQSRIGAAPWDAPLQYIENSPIFWAPRVQTPYLTIANDEDDAVPWYQGIEFFTALRRLGKEAYMFVFNGEKHGLRDRDNQKYWTVHLDEFFDHFLLGRPSPAWMDTGVPFLEKGTRDVSPLFKKPVLPPASGGKR